MAITNGYATLAEIKDLLEITDTGDDTLLELAVESASRMIDAATGVRFWPDATPSIRYYSATHADHLDIDPVATTTGLAVATDTAGDGTYSTAWVANTDYRLEPINADGKPFTRIVATGSKRFTTASGYLTGYRGVRVTATHGWAAVPIAIKQATLLLAARVFNRKHAPFSVLQTPEVGVTYVPKLDADVESLVRPYRVMWGVA